MKNYIGQTLWLILLVLLFTSALGWIPEGIRILGAPLRPMDIYADVRKADAEDPNVEPDSILLDADSLNVEVDSFDLDSTMVEGPLPAVDSFWFGKIIEDYSPEQQGISALLADVDSIRFGRVARIAFFGDSFVEGDILIGDLRDTLQSLWGGDGVGFVPITSKVARFKRTLVHDFKGWDVHSIVRKEERRPDYGLNGFVYDPRPGARVRYQGIGRWFNHTRSWSNVRLFYRGDSLSPIMVSMNSGESQPYELPLADGLGVVDFRSNWMSEFSMEIPDPGSLRLYGATLENGPGVYIDNFSVRGNSGGKLKLVRKNTYKEFDRIQEYDLIVLQFGLNAAGTSLRNINWYRQELDETFTHMKESFPGKAILVIGVPDRAGKIAGELKTMPSVPAITAMQRELARKHGLLFFDLYRGMGGPGTMIELSKHDPMLANKDYTHLTHLGGKHVSHLFTRILIDELARFRSQQTIPNF